MRQRINDLFLALLSVALLVSPVAAQNLVGMFLSDSGKRIQLTYDPSRAVYEMTPFHIPRYEVLTYTPEKLELLIRGFRLTLDAPQELSVSDGPITQISILPDRRGLRLLIHTDQPLAVEHTREEIRFFVRPVSQGDEALPSDTTHQPSDAGHQPSAVSPPTSETPQSTLSVLVFWDTGQVRRDTLTVDAEDFVEYRELGRISVRGLTPLAIQMFLTQELNRYLRQYSLVVYNRQVEGPSVTIVGALQSESMRGEHAWRSGMMLTATLNQIGGWTPLADLNHVWLYRLVDGEYEREIVDVGALLSHGGDLPLRPDDIVYLPTRREGAEVGVFGKVRQPGNLSIDGTTTLSQALQRAGVDDTVAASLVVSLLRANGERLDIPYAQIQGSRDLQLHHGDVIYLHTKIPEGR